MFLSAVPLKGFTAVSYTHLDVYKRQGVFFTLGGITVLYFITVTFFLPETKGRSLEEIEGYFLSVIHI